MKALFKFFEIQCVEVIRQLEHVVPAPVFWLGHAEDADVFDVNVLKFCHNEVYLLLTV